MDTQALSFAWAAFTSILSSEIGMTSIILTIVCIILIILETYVIESIEQQYEEWEQLELGDMWEQIAEILENSRFDEEVEEP